LQQKKTKGFKFTKKEYQKKDWDNNTPGYGYFEELQRVSVNRIIWGANYFIDKIPNLKNFIYWHKKGKSADDKFNEGEIAFVSCGRSRMVDYWWNGFGTINSGENRIHPTQKPIALYRWLHNKYGQPGQKILDTHLGSGSHAIAWHDFDHGANGEFVAAETDKDYYGASYKRFLREAANIDALKRQISLFPENEEPKQEHIQKTIFD